jgi:hypothetical protein
MPINASIQLPNFDNEFSKKVKKELQAKVASIMVKAAKAIKQKLEIEVYNAILTSQTWQAVKGGVLRGELGIQNVSSIDNILDTWAKGIQVEYERNTEFGILKIGMIRSDYSDVLSLPQSSFPYVSSRGGGIIEWLRWLLLESTQTIVAGYEFDPRNGGRTGLGIMVKTGGGWSVPPQYAGSATDNFATRSLQDIGNVIDKVVKEEVTRRL